MNHKDLSNEPWIYRQILEFDVELLCDIIARVIIDSRSSNLMSTRVLRYSTQLVSAPFNQEVAFLVLARLSPRNENTLSSIKNLITVFQNCLTGDGITVALRSAVVSCLVNFLPHLFDREADFMDFVPYMVQAVSKAVELHEDREAQRSLSLLIELVKIEPRCLQRHLGSVVDLLLNLGRSATPTFLETLLEKVTKGWFQDMLPLFKDLEIKVVRLGELLESGFYLVDDFF